MSPDPGSTNDAALGIRADDVVSYLMLTRYNCGPAQIAPGYEGPLLNRTINSSCIQIPNELPNVISVAATGVDMVRFSSIVILQCCWVTRGRTAIQSGEVACVLYHNHAHHEATAPCAYLSSSCREDCAQGAIGLPCAHCARDLAEQVSCAAGQVLLLKLRCVAFILVPIVRLKPDATTVETCG